MNYVYRCVQKDPEQHERYDERQTVASFTVLVLSVSFVAFLRINLLCVERFGRSRAIDAAIPSNVDGPARDECNVALSLFLFYNLLVRSYVMVRREVCHSCTLYHHLLFMDDCC